MTTDVDSFGGPLRDGLLAIEVFSTVLEATRTDPITQPDQHTTRLATRVRGHGKL
jgi:hypothetical protein